MAKISSNLSGAAGVYFTAAELSQRGFVASMTIRNARGIDILASNAEASKQVDIQVKTTQSVIKRTWRLDKSDEDYFADSLFYIFVNLKVPGSRPDFTVVPSKVVAKYAKERRQKYLATPGLRVRKRKDTSMRAFEDPEGKYVERWDLLDL